MTLNAGDLKIKSVRVGERPTEYYQDDETLTLRFNPPLPVGEEQRVVFEYECDRPYDGMFFTPASAGAPHYTAQVHT